MAEIDKGADWNVLALTRWLKSNHHIATEANTDPACCANAYHPLSCHLDVSLPLRGSHLFAERGEHEIIGHAYSLLTTHVDLNRVR